MTEVIVRYFHFIGIIVLASMLVTQNVLIAKSISKETLTKLTRVDAFYGLGAMLTLACGLLLWFTVGKSASFYNSNPIMHTKATLFIVVGVLSIFPTVFFNRNRRNETPKIEIPNNILVIKRLELVGLLIIPLLAVLMARGVGN